MSKTWTLKEIQAIVINLTSLVAEERKIVCHYLDGDSALVEDLGFDSLGVAMLISYLEKKFDVDLFAEGKVAITDIRTIHDVSSAYHHCLNGGKNNTQTEHADPKHIGNLRAQKRKQRSDSKSQDL